MNSVNEFPMSLQIKLASLAVHVEEGTSGDGHGLDVAAAQGVLNDPEVKAWLDSFDSVLLPRKRSADSP